MTERGRDVRDAGRDVDRLPLIAYFRDQRPEMAIVPAGRWRGWMNDTVLRFANRCLPLLVANESGWWLLNERDFTATWTGANSADGITVDYGLRQPPRGRAVSIFGYGVLSFEIPWLFRTPPGWDILVRGPANEPRDGIAPLEGIVETDWSVATFTMNWKFTRPGTVSFSADEPICMLVPHERRDLERFDPEVRAVAEDPSTAAGWDAFRRGRHEISVKKFLAEHVPGMEEARDGWQSDYFRGRRPDDGPPAPDHLARRRLGTFQQP